MRDENLVCVLLVGWRRCEELDLRFDAIYKWCRGRWLCVVASLSEVVIVFVEWCSV